LGDGTAFTAATWVSTLDSNTTGAPLFSRVYPSLHGSLSGTLTFQASASDSDFAGPLRWQRPSRSHGSPWMLGAVDTAVGAIGSEYVPEPSISEVAFGSINRAARLLLTGAGLSSPSSLDFTLSRFIQTVHSAPYTASLSVAKATGILNGTCTEKGSGASKLHGVFFQKTNVAEGLVERAQGVGSFTLLQQPAAQ
jgi:hypothetical protein